MNDQPSRSSSPRTGKDGRTSEIHIAARIDRRGIARQSSSQFGLREEICAAPQPQRTAGSHHNFAGIGNVGEGRSSRGSFAADRQSLPAVCGVEFNASEEECTARNRALILVPVRKLQICQIAARTSNSRETFQLDRLLKVLREADKIQGCRLSTIAGKLLPLKHVGRIEIDRTLCNRGFRTVASLIEIAAGIDVACHGTTDQIHSRSFH